MATRSPALIRFNDPAAFLARALPFLVRHEAEHNLLLGIAGQLAARPDAWGATPPYQGIVEVDGEVVAVAQRTPPRNLVVSRVEPRLRDAVLAALLADLRIADPTLPGVLGPTGVAEALANAWTGGPARWQIRLAERVYELTAVTAPEAVPGAMRRASAADRELVTRWMVAFSAEAMGQVDPEEAVREMVDGWFSKGTRTIQLWEVDGVPVSMVGISGETPNGIRVGPVYTPRQLRGRGYASALTAAVSQAELDAGRRFCFLFTDLANPTSNHIYQAIGYRPVADVTDIAFLPAS